MQIEMIGEIKVSHDESIGLDELRIYVEQEKVVWDRKGKALASIEVKLDGQDVEITSHEKSPITRVRRITGYLSTVNKFNDAKQAELKARKANVG
ncbi:hypothetical protein SDC9_15087 [bioreactor metagenome]|uniref:Uncharacterized protein n=1 Tax=bioreactor metagenome TaxID=1076179 RepID=A0A644TQR9_9ZZZZ|nr:anaerobic ribonucleoside-triphosphate reductase [Negativicutes bacterium]